MKKCKIYDKIYNNNHIFSSDFIFYPSLFDRIKENSIDLLIYKLELLSIKKDIDFIKKIDNIDDTEKIQYVENIDVIKQLNIKLL